MRIPRTQQCGPRRLGEGLGNRGKTRTGMTLPLHTHVHRVYPVCAFDIYGNETHITSSVI
jgi:hypothetical protein